MQTDVEFEMRVQVQTDPFLMPIENNAVMWPTRLSPRVPVATLRIPGRHSTIPISSPSPAYLRFNPMALPAGPPPAREPEPGAQAHV